MQQEPWRSKYSTDAKEQEQRKDRSASQRGRDFREDFLNPSQPQNEEPSKIVYRAGRTDSTAPSTRSAAQSVRPTAPPARGTAPRASAFPSEKRRTWDSPYSVAKNASSPRNAKQGVSPQEESYAAILGKPNQQQQRKQPPLARDSDRHIEPENAVLLNVGAPVQKAKREAVSAKSAAGKRGNMGDEDIKQGKGLKKSNGKNTPKAKKRTKGQIIFLNILKSVFMVGCFAIIAVSVFMVYISNYIVDSTDDDNIAIDKIMEMNLLSQTSYLVAQDPSTGEQVVYRKNVGNANSIWTDLDDIPPNMQNAVIAVEDQEFWKHDGVNYKTTIYATLNEIFHFRETFGASTIDQQLIKNITKDSVVVGDGGDTSAGYLRKIREIYRALDLNKNYSKQQILEAYLNTMSFSGKIVGVRAAAYEYFNKTDLNTLTVPECAMIAGITQHPLKYDPFLNYEACKERRNTVLKMMCDEGFITVEERDRYYSEELGLFEGDRGTVEGESSVNSYFEDYVFYDVVDALVENGVASNTTVAQTMYYNHGYTVEITIDLELQRKMEEVYELGYDNELQLFPSFEESAPNEADIAVNSALAEEGSKVTAQSAMVVLDYDGRLMGIVGGLGEKQGSLSLNRADSVRPIGSTIKPIVPYALAIENGLVTYSTMIPDSPSQIDRKKPIEKDPDTGEEKPNWPRNINGPGTNEQTAMWDALALSINTVPVILGSYLGAEYMYDHAKEALNFKHLDPNDANIGPMSLGSMTYGVTPVELAAAYQIIGNGGVYKEPRSFDRILDSDGNVIVDNTQPMSIQAISAETSFILNRMLVNVLTVGTARGNALNYMDSIAKTGSTDDYKDKWFVGLTPYYVSVLWWGYDNNQPLVGKDNSPLAKIWKHIMEEVQADKPEIGWTYLEGTDDNGNRKVNIEAVEYCKETGQAATENCPERGAGYYTADTVPEACLAHSDVDYDAESATA